MEIVCLEIVASASSLVWVSGLSAMACCVLHPRAPKHWVTPMCSLDPVKGNQTTRGKFMFIGRPLCMASTRPARTASFRASIVSAEEGDAPGAASTSSSSMDQISDPLQCLPGAQMGHSIQGSDVKLLYGEYMDHFWAKLRGNVPGLRIMDLLPEYQVQEASKARVHNWLLCGDRVRRVRFTYFDGGAAGQAFNSLLYPDPRYDLPLLGIDLLSFGSNKILCVVDFQPLVQDPEYLERHTSVLSPIYEKIRDKCGHMSSKFFDETQFFSKYLIFYRSSLGAKEPTLQVPTGKLWEVYLEYVDVYLKALSEAQSNENPDAIAYVKSRQDAYDQYNAERDPAIKLFNTYFGVEVISSQIHHAGMNGVFVKLW